MVGNFVSDGRRFAPGLGQMAGKFYFPMVVASATVVGFADGSDSVAMVGASRGAWVAREDDGECYSISIILINPICFSW